MSKLSDDMKRRILAEQDRGATLRSLYLKYGEPSGIASLNSFKVGLHKFKSREAERRAAAGEVNHEAVNRLRVTARGGSWATLPSPDPQTPGEKQAVSKALLRRIDALEDLVDKQGRLIQRLMGRRATGREYASAKTDQVLELLRTRGVALNYDQIVEATGLTISSARNIARRLVDRDLVSKSTQAERRGSRRLDIVYLQAV